MVVFLHINGSGSNFIAFGPQMVVKMCVVRVPYSWAESPTIVEYVHIFQLGMG